MVDLAPTGDLKLFWQLGSRTAARPGELCGVRWGDVDRDAGTVAILRNVTRLGEVRQTKTGSRGQRAIPLDLPAQALVRNHERRPGVEWLFADTNGDPSNPNRPARTYARVAALNELSGSIYDLGHFAATQWLAAGVPVPTVAKLLAHSNVTTTLNTYAHWVPAQGREAVEMLGAAIDAAR